MLSLRRFKSGSGVRLRTPREPGRFLDFGKQSLNQSPEPRGQEKLRPFPQLVPRLRLLGWFPEPMAGERVAAAPDFLHPQFCCDAL